MRTIYVDGSGNGRYGFVMLNPECESDRKSRWFNEKGITSNEAEYKAVIKALEACTQWGVSRAMIKTDSMLMFKQVTNMWKVKKRELRRLKDRIVELIQENDLTIEFKWIPREENLADKLI